MARTRFLSLIGAGGMGEVYKATDNRLNRTVAVKVLPPRFSENPEMKQRFEREAQAIAGLNHPHICTLFDVGRQDNIDYLVMEYLDGETLAERIARAPVPLEDALTIAVEIADALDKAHRQGVVHRDIKPSNVMLTASGTKLLDFGLAKLKQNAVETPSASMLPTSAGITVQGTILGTMQYMAPEQLEGKEADPRTDIFAFGTLLYETITGEKAFEGKSRASLIGAILKDRPKPVSTAQPNSPAALDRLIAVCLEKDPENRWQTTRDLLRELKWAAEARTQVAPSVAPAESKQKKKWVWVTVSILAIVLAAPPAFLYLRQSSEPNPIRFEVSEPGATQPVISPDGRWIVFIVGSRNESVLFVRPMDSLRSQKLAGTEGAVGPFWSPDSRSIAFISFNDGKLKRVDISGGQPQTICSLPSYRGGTWNRDGVILVGSELGGLYRVPAAGGTPVLIAAPNSSPKEGAFSSPYFLPDQQHYLYSVASSGAQSSAVYAGSLNSTDRIRLFAPYSRFVFDESGYLLFTRDGTLFAQPFDAKNLALTGEPVRVADEIVNSRGANAEFSASQNGIIVYRSGRRGSVSDSQFAWFDRTGKQLEALGKPEPYGNFDLSPDGKRLAVDIGDSNNDRDIWLMDIATGVNERLTRDGANNNTPVLSPDGKVAFIVGGSGGDIHVTKDTAIGESTALVNSPFTDIVQDWSKDGQYIAYLSEGAGSDGRRKSGLYVLPLFGDRKPLSIVETPFNLGRPQFSFDGKWIAYMSNESGEYQINLISFPAKDQRRQISANGGGQPRWRRDGKELYYLSLDGKLMAVELNLGAKIEFGMAKELFDTKLMVRPAAVQYAVTPNGQRFLIKRPVSEDTSSPASPITVVVNWMAGLRE